MGDGHGQPGGDRRTGGMKPLPLIIIGIVVGALVGAPLVWFPTLPVEASEQAGRTDAIYLAMVGVSGVIFGLVTVLLVVFIYRFRGRHGDLSDGAPIHGVTWLEALWTAIPAAIVMAIVVGSAIILEENDVANASNRINVHVEAYQFGWDFDYTDEAIGLENQTTLVLPVDENVRFDLTTRDVIHSFWVPAWRIQMNTTPTQTNTISVTPTKTGEFELVCAFLCGVGHAAMNSSVQGTITKPIRVVTRAEFDQWVAEQKAAAAQQGETGETSTQPQDTAETDEPAENVQ